MSAAAEFESTLWSQIARAQAHSRAAINRLLARYWAPVRAWLLAQGLQEADAEDLVQEVFRRVVEQDLLEKADRAKGRFRWLLLGITRNVMREAAKRRRAQKRGAGRAPLSLDAPTPEGERIADRLGAPCTDEQFDRLWVSNLIEEATRAVRAADRVRGSRYVDVLLAATVEGASQQEIAARFGLSIQDVKNAVHRAKKRVGAQIARRIAEYASSAEEYQDEVRFVSRFLGAAAEVRE